MKQADITSEIYDRMKELTEEGYKYRETAEILSREFDEFITKQNVCRAFQGKYQDQLNNVKSSNAYELEEDDIVFYVNKKDVDDENYKERIAIPLEEVGEICYDYTYGGLSGKKVQIKHGIKPRAWNLLKSRLNITKDSNAMPDVVLDYIQEKYGEQAVEEKILDVSHRAAKDKYRNRFIKQYAKSKERLDDKIRKTFTNQENYLSWLQDYISDYQPKEIDFGVKTYKNTDECMIVISDLHLGKQGTQEILKRLEHIASDIEQMNESIVHIVYLGDTVETIAQGGMHSGQLEKMEGPYGFDLLMYSVKIIEDFLLNISKTKKLSFHAIVGNHDRVTTKNETDNDRLGGLVIFELIKRGLSKSHIEINYYREEWNTLQILGFMFILNHGERGATKKKPKDILWELGDNKKHNIMLMGHVHHSEQEDFSENGIKIICPALAGRGDYDTKLLLSSYPGYKIIQNVRGLPVDTTIRLS